MLKKRDSPSRRRERRLRRRLVEERKRIYNGELSAERALSVKLTRALLSRARANPPRVDVEDPKPAVSTGDNKNLASPRALDAASSDDYKSVSRKGVTLDTKLEDKLVTSDIASGFLQPKSSKDGHRPIASTDGAFDVHCRAQEKKRKLADGPGDRATGKELRKKTRKENDARKEPTSKEEPIGSMTIATKPKTSDPNTKTNKVNGKSAREDKPRISRDLSISDTSSQLATGGEGMNGDKNKKVSMSRVKVDAQPKDGRSSHGSTVHNSQVKMNAGLPTEPWYKIHAKLIMEPDFDDLVYERRKKPKHRPNYQVKQYLVSGAIVEHPEDVAAVSNIRLCPPSSSPTLSSDEVEKVDKARKETETRTQARTSRTVSHEQQAARSCSRSLASPLSESQEGSGDVEE